MSTDAIVLLDDVRASVDRTPPYKGRGIGQQPVAPDTTAASEDQVALDFVDKYREAFRYVAPWHKWFRWDGKRWAHDSTSKVYECIRVMLRDAVSGSKAEKATANAAFVSGVERLARTDQRIVLLPEQLDADPWLLNTQGGIVDLKTGIVRQHEPNALMTKITGAAVDPDHGSELWAGFMNDISQGNAELADYLQRVAGYCATGTTNEDILVYLFGIGSNGKSSWAEAIAAALGDYSIEFAADVLMEARGERHPTEMAQFMGARLALTTEPAASATWNDSRVKSITGDAKVSARYMRGDFFTYQRTHKTIVIGNHLPRLNNVGHAIRRRMQCVPFRAVFEPTAGPGMRERIKAEALGAVLAWIVAGAVAWQAKGTSAPAMVRDLTNDYLADQDDVGQWVLERCDRRGSHMEPLANLHRDYRDWNERLGQKGKSNKALAEALVNMGFDKSNSNIGRVFYGLKVKGQ